VRAALLAQHRGARKRLADAAQDQRFARAVGVGDEIVRALERDVARFVEPLAQERAGFARERGDEGERVQRCSPGKCAAMRNTRSGLRDRVLAAIEIPALGVWLGALAGFAFVSAPLAFRIVAPLDVARFAALTAQSLAALTLWGYVLGAVAIAAALVRAFAAADRTWDLARAALAVVALALATYEQRAIVPAMTATADVRSPEYQALHRRSTQVYGGVVLLVLASLVLAAGRREE
jgi:hypothetical protein